MEAEDQQDATVRTGGQTDGSSDAAENWRRIQNAHAQNEPRMPQVAEDPWETEPMSVAREMIEAQKEDEEMAAVWAAQILEERFVQLDEEDRDRRRQEFTAQVQEEFISLTLADAADALREEQEQKQWAEEREQWRVSNKVVYIGELAERVTEDMLGSTFEQIGPVMDAGISAEKVGCGWVDFELVQDALEAIQRFDGVVIAGQAMVCGSSESVWEAQADY